MERVQQLAKGEHLDLDDGTEIRRSSEGGRFMLIQDHETGRRHRTNFDRETIGIVAQLAGFEVRDP